MIPDQQLSEDRRLRARLLVMKYATRKRQQIAIRDFLIEVLKNAPEDLHPIIRYLMTVYLYNEETLRKIIREVKPEEEQMMMSQFAQDVRRQYAQEIERTVREKVLAGDQGMMSQFAQDVRRQYAQEIEETIREKALQEGKLEGRLEGEAKLLLRMLPRRFGPLPLDVSERVYNADPDTIEMWADRVLDAKSLDEVFSK